MSRGRTVLVALALLVLGAAVPAPAQETIDFEGLPAGSIVNMVFGDGGSGPVFVDGFNPLFPSFNAAMIFDSANPTGGDVDLGSPNSDFGGPGIDADGNPLIGGNAGSAFQHNRTLGNILIVSEDLDPADPDDADVPGATLGFDFSALGPVTLVSVDVLDVDGREQAATIELLDGGGSLLALFTVDLEGDNGLANIGLGPTAGVVFMVVTLNGSGAIDNVVFLRPPPPGDEGCTPGYWKNHLEDWPPTGFDPGDDFDTVFGVDLFSPDITLEQAVNAKGGGVNKLARHGTAALLNAAHPDVDYPLTVADVIALVQAGDANTLVAFNELGCTIP